LELEVLMTAVAMESWHARHGYCPSCGQPTQVEAGGWVRRCPSDGTEHYPRTDPAIIVLVIDEEDRALLGRQARWPAPWRSALAGFVEPGERAESAVRREVAEEVGVTLAEVEYVSSQPWPFPGSLMLGFHARAATSTITVDGTEIAQADWYSRDALADAASTGVVQLPPSISIARGLIERWFGQPLPGSWLRG
jgi:NAD+ diphosphatase